MKQKLFFVIRAAVSIVLMAVLIYIMRDSIPNMIEAIKSLPMGIVLSGLIMFVLSVFVASLRLKVLLSTQEIFVTVIDVWKLTFVGYFFSSFLPTSVGGDVVKAFYISKASNKTMLSYATVFIDRFIGLCSLFLLAIGALIYSKEIPKSYINWLVPLLLIASGLFLIFLFNRGFAKILTSVLSPFIPVKLKEKFKDIYNAMHDFKNHKLKLIGCLLMSTGGQITAFIAIYFFVLGLNSYVPLKLVLLAMPVASILSMLPSIYGMGPREMSLVLILSPFIGKDRALAIAFLWLALLLVVALIGGIIHLAMGRYSIKDVGLQGR